MDESNAKPTAAVTALRKLWADHRIRFLFVGGFNTAFGFLMFVLVGLAVAPLKAVIGPALASIVTLLVSHLFAAVVAFILYRRFVFRVSGNVAIDFVRFESVYLVPLGANAILLPALVVWGVNQVIAQGLILITMTLVSYFGHRYFSFRRSGPAHRSAPPSMDENVG